jgi:hypothetical protein
MLIRISEKDMLDILKRLDNYDRLVAAGVDNWDCGDADINYELQDSKTLELYFIPNEMEVVDE